MKAKKGMVAKAIGGRTARPCDVCLRERARWYCAADEAYLCEKCDGAVHSANAVARRHERVRFAAGCAKVEAGFNDGLIFPGTRKRARSSRPHPHGAGPRSFKSKVGSVKDELVADPAAVPVPADSSAGDINLNLRADDDDYDEDDDDLLPQVPTFVPMAEELCGSRPRDVVECPVFEQYKGGDELKGDCGGADLGSCDLDQLLNSETDLSGFGVDMDMDVESIIGHGLDEGLGVLGFSTVNWDEKRVLQCRDMKINEGQDPEQQKDGDSGPTGLLNNRTIKAEEDKDRSDDLCSKPKDEGDHHVALKAKQEPDEPDQSWDTIELDLDQYHEDEEEELEDGTGFGDQYCMAQGASDDQGHDYQDVKIEFDPSSILIPGQAMYSETKLVSLSLNYEDVLTAWSDRGSPWASLHDCNSDGGGCQDAGLVPELGLSYNGAQLNIIGGGGGQEDSCRNAGGGREARVLRYREKRRTRLFSKKIRYEVRKLNAEKRPRMKGRFVKRTPGMFCD